MAANLPFMPSSPIGAPVRRKANLSRMPVTSAGALGTQGQQAGPMARFFAFRASVNGFAKDALPAWGRGGGTRVSKPARW